MMYSLTLHSHELFFWFGNLKTNKKCILKRVIKPQNKQKNRILKRVIADYKNVNFWGIILTYWLGEKQTIISWIVDCTKCSLCDRCHGCINPREKCVKSHQPYSKKYFQSSYIIIRYQIHEQKCQCGHSWYASN